MKKRIIFVIGVVLVQGSLFAFPGIRILGIKGDVKVRTGLDEEWNHASSDMALKEIDTILTGENSEAILVLGDGVTFTLGSHSILDIGDLRRITERELFLFLMSQKISKIDYSGSQSKLHIENVSVVRAEKKGVTQNEEADLPDTHQWKLERNGAEALYRQAFFPNAIVKFHKILDKYPDIKDCGETCYYLGKSFEAIKETGRARDAYQAALSSVENESCLSPRSGDIAALCREALDRLKE